MKRAIANQKRDRLIKACKLFVIALMIAFLLGADDTSLAQTSSGPPNIIFLFTDDQDAASLRYMPNVERLLIERGTTFGNALFTFPLCCPSRATFLRGQYSHNTNITDNSAPGGGEPKFRKTGLDRSTSATWLNKAGYRTGYVGKYMNGYSTDLYVPPGWDQWRTRFGNYESEVVNVNGTAVKHPGEHMDRVFGDYALDLIKAWAPRQKPFFLTISFEAAHLPATFEPKYADLFQDTPLPRSPNFDEEDRSDKPTYVRKIPALSQENIAEMERAYRNRLRSLQTVDITVSRIVTAVKENGDLSNTYFFFFTDNGFHMGNHALLPAKRSPYEEDIRFPLIVRGPNVPAGAKRSELVLNNDLAPTFADLGGAEAPGFVDGRSFAPLLRNQTIPWRDAALIEGSDGGWIPAYDAVRTNKNLYVEYETGEKELYALQRDPYQLQNIHESADPALVARLQTRLKALKDCQAVECRKAEGER